MCVFVLVSSLKETGWSMTKVGPSDIRAPPSGFTMYEYAHPRDLREGDIIQVTHVNSDKCLATSSPSGRLILSESNVLDVAQYFYCMLDN
jgi:hypothetical protein